MHNNLSLSSCREMRGLAELDWFMTGMQYLCKCLKYVFYLEFVSLLSCLIRSRECIVNIRAFLSLRNQGTMMKFAKNLATWAGQEGVKEVIILSGLDSGKVQRSETNVYVTFPSCFHFLLL